MRRVAVVAQVWSVANVYHLVADLLQPLHAVLNASAAERSRNAFLLNAGGGSPLPPDVATAANNEPTRLLDPVELHDADRDAENVRLRIDAELRDADHELVGAELFLDVGHSEQRSLLPELLRIAAAAGGDEEVWREGAADHPVQLIGSLFGRAGVLGGEGRRLHSFAALRALPGQ